MHVRNEADHGLDAHTGEPAQLPDQLSRLRFIFADVEGERAGLFDRIVISALGLAMSAQNTELFPDLRAGPQAAGVCVARHQAQGLPLAVPSYHDRRIRPGEALREVERPLKSVVC